MTMQVQGLQSTLKTLSTLKPKLKKEFFKDAREIVSPAVDEAKGAYKSDYLSGMSRAWTPKGRPSVFPWDSGPASAGVAVKTSLSKRNDAVLSIVQKDVAASILDMAGKKSDKRGFASHLTAKSDPPSRVMWRSYEHHAGAIEARMALSVEKVMAEITMLEKLVF